MPGISTMPSLSTITSWLELNTVDPGRVLRAEVEKEPPCSRLILSAPLRPGSLLRDAVLSLVTGLMLAPLRLDCERKPESVIAEPAL